MKKPFLIMLCGLIAIVSACSKKNNPSPSASIVGRWAIQSDTSRAFLGGPSPSIYVVVGINSPWCQFNADGTGLEKFNIGLPDDTIHFTYHVSHDSLYFVHSDEVIRGRDYGSFSYRAVIQTITQHQMITINKFGTGPTYIEDEYFSR